MLNLTHKKLTVWKESMKLNSCIYELTQQFPQSEKYGLSSQLRRAVISVSSNISEGASRTSIKDRVRFFEIARSSLVELDTQLEIAYDLGFLSKKELDELDEPLNLVFAMLSNLMKNYKQK